MDDQNPLNSLTPAQGAPRSITSDRFDAEFETIFNLIPGPIPCTLTSPSTTLEGFSPPPFFSEIDSPLPSPSSPPKLPPIPRTFQEYASTSRTKLLTTVELIRAALLEMPDWKATSSEICHLIADNDERYQTPERFTDLCGNVRQRLSRTPWFQLAERPIGQKGKARSWAYIEHLDVTSGHCPRPRRAGRRRHSRRSSNDGILPSTGTHDNTSSSGFQDSPIAPLESPPTIGAPSSIIPNLYVPPSTDLPVAPVVQGDLAVLGRPEPIPTNMAPHVGTDGFGVNYYTGTDVYYGIEHSLQSTPPPFWPFVTEVTMPMLEVASASAPAEEGIIYQSLGQ
ncbi:hypothetical protein FRB94_008422 [Tulasnella sp. JGI-2019a]|nr:hypothetical protein FRB93_007255 [Tulasnella sp. JGI-2019a]KAG8996273.1 hypothetical protein FRB94_008422 [Tulasnella sp. JGI-2019a]KAG9030976.1 hypothetical protein FRB95_003256 [Tulasnella sp. JGI-2019a]